MAALVIIFKPFWALVSPANWLTHHNHGQKSSGSAAPGLATSGEVAGGRAALSTAALGRPASGQWARSGAFPAGPGGGTWLSAGGLPRSGRGLSRLFEAKLWAALLVMGLILVRASSADASCDCGTIATVVKSAAQTIVSGIVGPLDTSIQQAASYSTENLHRDLVALRESVLLAGESISASVKSAEQAQAQRDFEKTWDLTAQPVTGCDNDHMGGVLLGAEQTARQAGQAVMNKADERRRRYSRSVDYLREMETFPDPGLISESLGGLSAGRTYTANEFKEAERFLEALSEPLPPAELPEGAASGPAGMVYQIQKKDYETRQNLYQSVLARRLSDRAPTAEGLADWAADKWALMGGDGPPPGVVDGRMSKEALFWLLTNLRVSSANWHEQVLPALPEAGLLREITAMMAVELELSRKRNEHLENIAMMMALEGLDNLRRSDGEALRLQYRRSLGSELGQ